jgi:type IV secretory pathway VirJ component
MVASPSCRAAAACLIAAYWAVLLVKAASPHDHDTLTLRGHTQTLHVYGTRGGQPVLLSSGDGGWIHLAPHVADVLSQHGYFVVGFDIKAYLEAFTTGTTALREEDEPGDYKTLIDFARQGSTAKPVLIGVSEGAGLSVLAARDPHTKPTIAGVIGLGLCDLTELAWRWKDALIYLTHGTPHEPTFSTAAIVGGVAPLPLAAIHSTHDEFVPLGELQRVLDHAHDPKRLWIVPAINHRFSDNLTEFDRCLLEAIDWVTGTKTH